MRKIWVTGSKGQLGMELHLQQARLNGYQFLFTDIEELDLRNGQAVLDFAGKEKPDWIINCAAYTAVDKAEEEPELAFALNSGIPAHLNRVTEDLGGRLIHLSTDYVFDGMTDQAYTEEDIPHPISKYAESKYAGEIEALKNRRNIILRTSWLYSSHGKNFVKTMLRLGREREKIGVVSDQFGSPTSVIDLAAVLLKIISTSDTRQTEIGGIYHFADEGICSWYDFATAIMQLAGLSCKVEPIPTSAYPTPARRPMYSAMDKSKIKNEFEVSIPEWRESLTSALPHILNSD